MKLRFHSVTADKKAGNRGVSALIGVTLLAVALAASGYCRSTQNVSDKAAGPQTETKKAAGKSGSFDPDHLRQLLATTRCYLCDLQSAPLAQKSLAGADLQRADLRNASLEGANLRDAQLLSTDLSGANLNGADLREANFLNARANNANFSGANLRGAQLLNASLQNADLRGADFTDAVLRGANLTGAKTKGMILRGTQFKETTLPDGTSCSDDCEKRIPL